MCSAIKTDSLHLHVSSNLNIHRVQIYKLEKPPTNYQPTNEVNCFFNTKIDKDVYSSFIQI